MPSSVLKQLLDCLSSCNKSEEQSAFIDKLSREEIISTIPDIILSHSAASLVRLILDGLTNSSKSRDGLVLSVMVQILDDLSEGDIPDQKAIDIVEILGLNCCHLNSNELAKIIQHCLSFLKNGRDLKGKWLSLFPLLISELLTQPYVTVDGTTLSGVEYFDEIINNLCDIKIQSEDAVAFAGILRELEMPVTAINRFIEKLCDLLPEMEPQEIPPLLYQLLFLCDSSSHMIPVEAVAKYFNEKLANFELPNETRSVGGDSMEIDVIESSSPREVLMAKATSIFHIASAASAGHVLSREFPKFLRNHVNLPEKIMMPFILEVALSLGGLPQLRDVIDTLKSVVQKCLTLKEKLRHSAWLKDIISGKVLQAEELLINVMQQCTAEWDHIVKGLELLAFSLLEMRSPGLRPSTGASAISSAPTNPIPMMNQSSQQSKTILHRCWHIGSQILCHMIKKFPDSAQAIVQNLVERLQDNSNDSQYIDTITLLVQQAPLTMLDCKNSFTNILYYMDYGGMASAKRLYSGISPLFRSAPALRETALLVLRKLMHSCSEEARQVAVVGFMQILKHFRYYSTVTQGISSSQSLSSAISTSSQATVDMHYNTSTNANRVLCTELIQRLQSSLNQQAAVRQTLYECLPEVVSRNPELVPECVKMLRNHLKFFVEQQSSIQLDLCVSKGDKGNVQVIEPLGHSIQALMQVIVRSGLKKRFEKDEIDGNTEDEIDQGLLLLRKMTKSLSEATLNDFELGDVNDSPLKAQSLMSICVALMDFCLTSGATANREWAQILINLFHLLSQIESSLKEGPSKSKGKGKKKDAADETVAPAGKKSNAEVATLSLQNLSHLISALFNEPEDDDTEAGTTLLKSSNNTGLHQWALESAFRKYRLLRINGEVEGLSAESIVKYSGTLGRALMVYCCKRRNGGESQVYCTALECLYELIQAICYNHPTKTLRVLTTMDGVEMMAPNNSLEQQVTKILEHFQAFLDHILSGRENENVVVKAVLPITGTLTVLSDQLDPKSSKYNQLAEWTLQLCKTVDSSDSTVVKTLVSFLIHLTFTSKSNSDIILELARSVRCAVGDLEASRNSTTSTPGKFACINEDTASVVLSVVANSLEQLLQTTTWAIHRIGTDDEDSLSIETSTYANLITVVNAQNELVQTDFAPGVNSELVLKTSSAVYTTMGHIAKRQGKVLNKQFEKLCKLLATGLTPHVYNFISHIEGAQSDASKKGKKPKGKANPDQDKQKVLKRTRAIPVLIFALEQFSKTLMTISKRTKTDLSFGFKPGTSRDFRIKDAVLQDDDDEEDEEEEEDADDGDEEENARSMQRSQGPSKRPLMYAMSGNPGKGSKRGRGRGRKV